MPKQTILLVEDDHDHVKILTFNLKSEGYHILAAKSAETGLALARKKKPDLILLDIALPGMDGLDMIKVIRQESKVPVVFLTARKTEVDRVLGFTLGADDYITKPFSVAELRVRIKAILQRAAPKPDLSLNGAVHIGAIEVNFERHEVRVNGKYRELTPREFQLLKLLIEAAGKVLSREDMLDKVWGVDKSAEICTRTVDQHIARVRRKLLSERHRIATVTHSGYKMLMH